MELSITIAFAGIIGLVISIVEHLDRQEILKKGRYKDGLVKYRYWKGFQYIRNHWDYRLTATVEYEGDDGMIVVKELTHKRRLYLPPVSNKHIKLVLFGGDVYDLRMLNRKLEIGLSILTIIVSLSYYFLG